MKSYIYLFLTLFAISCTRDPSIQLFNSINNDGARFPGQMLLQIDSAALKDIVSRTPDKLSIQIPYTTEQLNIDLVQMDLFDKNFKLNTDKETNIPFIPGVFYTGKISGDTSSLVSLSLINNEVSGIISSDKLGTLDLNRSNPEDNSEYLLYTPADEIPPTFDCFTNDSTTPDQNSPKMLRQVGEASTGCVGIDFEITYGSYVNFQSSVTATANWMTTIFSGMKSICLADGINVSIKSIYVHTSPDGYSTSAATALDQVRTKRVNDPLFTGDLVHLIAGQSSGSNLMGIAYLDVLCSPYSAAYSKVTFAFAAPPAYSWTVMVVTHESGHAMGSNHTHWCGWPGGPIDNCTTQEGSCNPGPTPPFGGGTIMSYCHQKSNVTIRFSNGFGPLPKAKIQSRISAATCLTGSCGGAPAPTCSDGIKNGTETGIDCGGTCPPCPRCNDGIKNQNETGVDCGGVCAPCPIVPPPTDPLISKGKPAAHAPIYSMLYPASNAVDSNTATFQSTHAATAPYWQVDLTNQYSISRIRITNRTSCCGDRLKNFKVYVSVDNIFSENEVVFTNTTTLTTGQIIEIPMTRTGRYVKVLASNSPANYLHMSEVEIYGKLIVPCIPVDTIYKIVRDSVVIHKIVRDSVGKTKCL